MADLIDCHAHLEAIDNLKIVLLRAKEAGIVKIISCGSSVEWSRKCVNIAESDTGNLVQIYACVGVHPQDGKEDLEKLGEGYIEELRKLAKSDKVVAIGECGMDYMERDKRQVASDKKSQGQLFKEQIKLAYNLKLPIVVHCRNAWDDMLTVLEKNKKYLRHSGMFHSWTGTLRDAKRAIDLGFHISISGIVTFANAGEIVDVAKWAPVDKLLVETDTPFLSPIPFRGKPNEPKNVRITAQFLAKLRDVSLDEIAQNTTRNAEKLFGL